MAVQEKSFGVAAFKDGLLRLVFPIPQGVRRASYLDVSPEPEALSDGAQGGVSPGGRGSRRASVCMAAEALMAGMKDKDKDGGGSASSSTRAVNTNRAPPLGDARSVSVGLLSCTPSPKAITFLLFNVNLSRTFGLKLDKPGRRIFATT